MGTKTMGTDLVVFQKTMGTDLVVFQNEGKRK